MITSEVRVPSSESSPNVTPEQASGRLNSIVSSVRESKIAASTSPRHTISSNSTRETRRTGVALP